VMLTSLLQGARNTAQSATTRWRIPQVTVSGSSLSMADNCSY
jgi:hypothetical protein